jgi:hypothetical protein
VDVFAVSTWADRTKPDFSPGEWLKDERWPVRTIVDDRNSGVGSAFGLRGTPFWVFLDRTAVVVIRVEAELGGDGLARAIAALTR